MPRVDDRAESIARLMWNQRDHHRHILRQRAIGLVGLLFALGIGTKLVVVQYLANDAYTDRAESQHVRDTPVRARRGRILDRNHRVLATTLESQSFFVNHISDADTRRAIAVRFSSAAGESTSRMMRKMDGERSFVWLARKMVDGPDLDDLPEGVGRVVEMRRSYPMSTVAGQLIGYTDVDNVGIEGLEASFDPLLRGHSGEISSRVDALGRVIGDFGVVKLMPEDGADLVLAIDADYQSIAEEELETAVKLFESESGIAIVSDPGTGEILAMANVPLYDPNQFGRYPQAIRRNRAVTDIFEPGSTFKIVAVAGALEESFIGAEDSVFCEYGRLEVEGGVIGDTHPFGWLTVGEVIEESSNIGTIKIARTLGQAGLFRYARMFGFGSVTGGGLQGEVTGSLAHPTNWSGRSLESIAIGQEVGSTALQVVTAYAAIANGGYLLAPQIYRFGQRGRTKMIETTTDTIRRVVSAKTAETMRDFLEGVVARGTGSRASVAGYRVAGKTGTAQKAYENRPGYDPDRYVSSFVGFLPAEAPELLCLVVVDSPRKTYLGSKVAAPVFSRIMQRILSRRGTPVRHRATLEVASKPEALQSRPALPQQLSGQVPYREVAALSIESEAAGLRMPDVVGVPLRRAVSELTQAGFRVKATGSGRVIRQIPSSGSVVLPGTMTRVTCRTSIIQNRELSIEKSGEKRRM